MSDRIVYVEKAENVATVRFDRGRDPNPLSVGTLMALTDAALELAEDESVTAVVLTGRPRVFTAGVDLKDPEMARTFDAPVGEKRRIAALGPKMCRAWEAMPQVTIAAIEGYCMGGGVSLAVSCDFRVMGGAPVCPCPSSGWG